MIKSILLATDGSEHAGTAWQYALDLAKAYDARLRVVSVVDVGALYQQTVAAVRDAHGKPVALESVTERETQMEAALKQLLEETRRKTEAAGVKVKVSLERGIPADAILSQAALVDLIVLGHRGQRSRWDVFFLGSVAEAVSQKSCRPVFVAPVKYAPIKHVLAAYDGSKQAQHALHGAAELAATMRLPLDVLHVTQDHAAGQAVLREAREYLKPYDVPRVSGLLREGNAVEQILETATRRGAGLIVMGAHGHSRIREALLGSVTDEVLRKTTKPLLMTR
jgi:nucleotide-binding universal stress UspA family protein